jgi:glycosyltransferase involved in cell wall biosynthesis/GT2 family glycosyltransferase
MPRVLFALPGLHRVVRGAETAFEEVAKKLAAMPGYKVTLMGSGELIPGRPYDFVHVPCRSRERFERWPSLPTVRTHYEWEELSFAWNLAKVYEPARFDITVACSWPWVHWLLRSRKTAGYRAKHIFVTENGDHMVSARQREYHFFNCDGLICTNHEYFERNKNRFPSTLIPNGVDPQVFTPGKGDRAKFGLPESGRIALMVSALIESKRVADGIRACARISDLHLAVAGDGELRSEIERFGKDLMPGRFHLLKLPREQMPELYRCADVFVHMSIDEPSANVYLEALATGLPIVTHDRPVTRWTLEDQAVLIDTRDSTATTEAIVKASRGDTASNLESRRQLGERRFSWTSLAEEYAGFFEKVVRGAVGSASADVTLQQENRPLKRTLQMGAVVIGRNEGERLKKCIDSLLPHFTNVVYVDSGSVDGSVEWAKSQNVTTVELDTSVPFTAARARNAGIAKLLSLATSTELIQTIDGDCEFLPEFLPVALRALDKDPKLAAVCGRRRERHPDASVYNKLTDIEWDTPVGPADSVGGDALFRVAALKEVDFYNPSLIAGEEPEMCLRLRSRGWHILRVDQDMTLHDAAMTQFGQWWKRTMRSGHAFAEGFAIHGSGPQRFNYRECRSIVLYALLAPLVILALLAWHPVIALLVAIVYPLLVARIYLRKRSKLNHRDALLYATFTVLGKFAQLVGMARYAFNRAMNRRNQLIEYKTAHA